MPPPEPRSSTVSPGLSSASAVGLPQPRDAADPQHASLEDVTRSAALAYLSFTMLLMSCSAMAHLLLRRDQELQQDVFFASCSPLGALATGAWVSSSRS